MATSQFRLRKVEPLVLALVSDLSAGLRRRGAAPDPTRSRPPTSATGARAAPTMAGAFRIPGGLTCGFPPARRRRRSRSGVERHLSSSSKPSAGSIWASCARMPIAVLRRRPISITSRPGPARPVDRAYSFRCRASTGCSRPIARSRRIRTTISAPSPTPRSCACPEALRRHGYRAEMFNAGDTDWDNSNPWLLLLVRPAVALSQGRGPRPDHGRSKGWRRKGSAGSDSRAGRSSPSRRVSQQHAVPPRTRPRSTSPARTFPRSASSAPRTIPTMSSASSSRSCAASRGSRIR